MNRPCGVGTRYHSIGSKIICLFLADHGYQIELLARGLPDEELFEYLKQNPSYTLGISVALPEMIPAANRLWHVLKERYKIPVYFGGHAFRQTGVMAALDQDMRASVLLTADDALKRIKLLSINLPLIFCR